jgi:UDP-N-acetylmuramoyl-tripeptide--D-alanyl-D-alanine ligase
LFFAIIGERADGHDFVRDALGRGAVCAVVSRPELFAEPDADRFIMVRDTIEALGRLGAYHRRQLAATVIGVTGSNGKTTTRELIHHVLSGSRPGRQAPKSFNNQIGVPLTLLSPGAADEFLVVELGSNAPGEIQHLAELTEPDVGVLVSIGPAHLAGLGSIEGVAREKLSLFAHLRSGGLAVVPADEPLAKLEPPKSGSRTVVRFGESANADIRMTAFRQRANGFDLQYNGRFDVHVPMLGRFNAMNALAAIVVARRFGLEHEQIGERLASFRGPAMRLERMMIGDVEVILDAYNANPASTQAALDVFDSMKTTRRRVVVLGDMGELGEDSKELHREIGLRLARSSVRSLVCIGKEARLAASRCGKAIRCHRFGDTEAAMDALDDWLEPGDLVLLKGSRSMRLERITEAMQKRVSIPAAGR